MIDLKARKSLGQNFLVDKKALARIVETIDPKEGDAFIEVGPGTGLLTRELLASPLSTLLAFELDERAIPELIREFASEGDRFQVIQQDFLTVDLGAFTPSEAQLRIAGNIPYYITSPILFKLIDDRAHVRDATLLVQLEVAERITAQPRTKAYGIPTVLANFFGEVRFGFRVPAGAFRPIPKVDSAVIAVDFSRPYFTRLGSTAPSDFNEKLFRKIVRGSFAMRRKTLRNNIKSLFGESGVEALNSAGLGTLLDLRAEALPIEQFIELTQALSRL